MTARDAPAEAAAAPLPDAPTLVIDQQQANGDSVVWSVVATAFRVASRPLRVVAGASGMDVPRRVEEAAVDAVATPAAQRAIDEVLAGPLPEMVGRSLGRQRVVERLLTELLGTDDELDGAVVSALETERVARLLREALESAAVQRLLTEAVESRLTTELTDEVVERVVTSPQLRAVLAEQSASFAGDVAVAVRARAAGVDAAAERRPRRWLGRSPRPAVERVARNPVRYAGVATRGIALAADAAITGVILLVGAALFGLAASLVGDVRPAWLAAALVGAASVVVEVVYFAGFWSTTGQTPGMRMLGVRVVGHEDTPPGFGRSLARFGGLVLAIVPCFAGFLPALVDDRRRALPDLIAGTVVVYGETASIPRTAEPR